MKEREQWGRRGPVRACQLQRTWFTRRCGADACETEEGGDSTTLNFREDGSLAERSHRNPNGSEWTSIYQYNRSQLTAVRTENRGLLASLSIYEYDEVGRLLQVVVQSANGDVRTAESYEYDPDGRKTKTFCVDVASQRPDTQYGWGVEGTDSGYSAPSAATLKALYNKREQPTCLLFYDATGCLLSRVEFSYDDNANLIEEAQTNTADVLPPEMLTAMSPAQRDTVRAMLGAAGQPVRRMHRYDGDGRRVETHLRMGLLGGDITTMVYNQGGDQIAQVAQHEAREYGVNEEGQLTEAPIKKSISRSEARYRYDYDANGNWLLKTVEVRSTEDQEFAESTVERRTIEYFGLT